MTFSLSTLSAHANEDFFATVAMLKGKAKVLLVGQTKTHELVAGERIPRGATVATAEQSFVRLILRDNSTINVGPDSRMEMIDTPKGSASMLNVINGQIRAKVTKDVLKAGESREDKLRITTKTAAMGVRGTDFLVAFNKDNNITSLLTFEGKVAMAKLEDGARPEAALQTDKVVFVTEGTLSTVKTETTVPSEPVKLSPTQFEQLKGNDSLVPPAKLESKNGKAPIPAVPPFVNAANFMAKPQLLANVKADLAPQTSAVKSGMTGNNSVVAGAMIDLKTAIVVSPPPGSLLDPVTGVLVPPANLMKTDEGGHMVLADGLKMSAKGIEVDKTAMAAMPAEHAQTMQFAANIMNAGSSAAMVDSAGNMPPPPPPNMNLSWVMAATTMQAGAGGTTGGTMANLGMGAPPPGMLPPPPGGPNNAPPPDFQEPIGPPPPPPCPQCQDGNVTGNLPPSTTAHFNITVH